MILVDTYVWIDHLRRGESKLAAALAEEQVLTHPFVIGELACGNLKNRTEVIPLLQRLPQAAVAADAEVLGFIERRGLIGRGIGYLDTHLLASAALSAAKLWTRDKRLAAVATTLELDFGQAS